MVRNLSKQALSYYKQEEIWFSLLKKALEHRHITDKEFVQAKYIYSCLYWRRQCSTLSSIISSQLSIVDESIFIRASLIKANGASLR